MMDSEQEEFFAWRGKLEQEHQGERTVGVLKKEQLVRELVRKLRLSKPKVKLVQKDQKVEIEKWRYPQNSCRYCRTVARNEFTPNRILGLLSL